MTIFQIYETTIMSKDSEHAMQVLVLPKTSMPSMQTPVPVETVFKELELRKLAGTDPSNLAHHLAVLLSQDLPETDLFQAIATAVMEPQKSYQLSENDLRFAELMSFERIIPFEESPLELESLAKLATTASGAGLGAYIGFVVFGTSPLLFIAVPAGIVLCCAARGLGQGLEEGLRVKVREWLKGKKGMKAAAGEKAGTGVREKRARVRAARRKEPEGPRLVPVPNVIGKTEADAVAAIREANLEVGKRERQRDRTLSDGTVISQSPAGGSSMAQGSAVSFVISRQGLRIRPNPRPRFE
jgi:PASTA domain